MSNSSAARVSSPPQEVSASEMQILATSSTAAAKISARGAEPMWDIADKLRSIINSTAKKPPLKADRIFHVSTASVKIGVSIVPATFKTGKLFAYAVRSFQRGGLTLTRLGMMLQNACISAYRRICACTQLC